MPGKPKKKTTTRQASLKMIVEKIDQLRSDMEAGFKQTNEQLRSEMQAANEQLRGEMQAANEQLRGEMHAQIGQLRGEMHAQIGQLRSEMHDQIGQLRSEMQAGNEQLRAEMHAGFEQVNTRISSVEKNLAALDAYTRENLDALGDMIPEAGHQAYQRIDQRAKEWHDKLTEVQAEARRTSLLQDERTTNLENKVERLQAEVATLRQEHVELQQQVETLSTKPS